MNADERSARLRAGFEESVYGDGLAFGSPASLRHIVERLCSARSRLAAAREYFRRQRADWAAGDVAIDDVRQARERLDAARMRLRESKRVALDALERHVGMCAGIREESHP